MPTMITAPHAVEDLTSGRLQIDIKNKIHLLDPNDTPATFVSKMVSTRKAKQPVVSWDTDEYRPSKDQVSGAHLVGATDPNVDNPSYFQTGDLWRVFDSLEIIYIVEGGSNPLTVIRNFPGVAAGGIGAPTALADDDWLELMGNVSGEGSLSPEAVMTQEVQHDNYCEITKTPFELTETEVASLYNTEAPLPYNIRKYAREHLFAMERKFFWGIPSASQAGTNGKLIRTMGGAYYWIASFAPSANIISQADLTEAEFLEGVRNSFRYGTGTKFMFAAPLFHSAFEHWGWAKTELRPTDKKGGIALTMWQSPHGLIHLVNHKMLEGPNVGTAGGWAFLLDMEEIESVPLRDTRFLTGIQPNDADYRKAQYLTEGSSTWGQMETHAVYKDVTSFS